MHILLIPLVSYSAFNCHKKHRKGLSVVSKRPDIQDILSDIDSKWKGHLSILFIHTRTQFFRQKFQEYSLISYIDQQTHTQNYFFIIQHKNDYNTQIFWQWELESKTYLPCK